MERGDLTAVDLVEMYLARIEAYDEAGPELNAFIHLNTAARRIAAELDTERGESGPRGPLHGIPVAIKDNVNTSDMPTTAGSLALEGFRPQDDAFQVQRLREAGAIIIGKTNLPDFAYSWSMASSLGGQTLSAYDAARDPTGSSGGSAVAVTTNMAAGGFGTDTCGSIRLPAAMNNLYAIRPTSGLSSRSGVIPLSTTLDAMGPMARTVIDLALLLDATVGRDPADATTVKVDVSFVESVDPSGLTGRRIGYLPDRDYLQDGIYESFEAVLDTLEANGVELVAVSLPETPSSDPFALFDEFSFALDDFLSARPEAPRSGVEEIYTFYDEHPELAAFRPRPPVATIDTFEYQYALERRGLYREALLALMDEHELDAIAYPGSEGVAPPVGGLVGPYDCESAVLSGMPSMVIPAGPGPGGLPLGVELLGRPFDEATLLAIAAGYEANTDLRRLPPLTPPLE